MKKEEIEYHIENILTCNGGQLLKDQLVDLFIELSNEKWIELKTCNDVLPEMKDDNVLVHFANGSIETVHIEDFFEDIKSHVDDDGYQVYTKWYLSTEVTHWMKLPDAPSLH